ncbi:MAG: septum site-determining protein MinC [Candidatus Eremiobacteraeota bacterium]|nr:septum site-determining protein MinC [Candidatus Eremiobacteraeota bacterium]MBV8339049.1 septum site-determining protein MinC [Candidatus Eremiobacteraeota bacterium]MBV8669297.1 septum site-determining protein MinC [Candidatus Eremiobacteraeota bacterium]
MQIKGTKSGLLLHMHERPLTPVVSKLRERLGALPNFYRGGRAVLMLGDQPLEAADLAGITAILQEFGIIADGAVCDADDVAAAARAAGLRIVAASVAAAPRVRDDRTEPADVRKARHEGGDEAAREAFRQRRNGATEHGSGAENCFYKGTLRSGQSLSAFGNILVLGDVNAGAELIATKDIVVWGTLRGVAHAGAEGDDTAAVYALRLEPTQLRISRCIASAPSSARAAGVPEVARVVEGKITIQPALGARDKVRAR